MLANIYKNRKVFITGHTGFKGAWLSCWLLALGAEVTGFSLNIPTKPSAFAALNLANRMRDLRGDICDYSNLKTAIAQTQPDIVFHLAAQALVRESYREPALTMQTNAIGTMNVLEAIRATGSVQAGVFITSDKCYRNDEWVYGYRETDYLGGHDPYSASKGCAEIIAHSWFQSFFQERPACATVRAGNVIGGGDWAKDRIVPDCARAWQNREPVRLRSPNATRPWQHVLEPLSGYLWLGAQLLNPDFQAQTPYPIKGEAFNFGPPADAIHSVGAVVQGLARHWPGFQFETGDQCGMMKECGLLKLCCDKALASLNWKATLDFEETIRYTADWYARYHAENEPDMWDYTTGQIAAYANAAQAREILWAQETF